MTPFESRCLDAFPNWLRSLGQDTRQLAAIAENRELALGARRSAAIAVNYLFKSLDLIPDGLEDLGFIDDAFVFRVAAAIAVPDDAQTDTSGTLRRLADEAALVREFLGDVYPKLEAYVARLEETAARGRKVSEVLSNESLSADFARDARQWADGFQAPAFLRDEKNLVKLRSFLAARLK
jgi:uncharacterized membrane protein YkvA (DUF1232 family)